MVGWNEDHTAWTPLTAEKQVIVEVLGGDSDGLILDSQNPTATPHRVDTLDD